VPLDGKLYVEQIEQNDPVLAILQGGLARVKAGYSPGSYSRRRLFGNGRLFCMAGAIDCTDDGRRMIREQVDARNEARHCLETCIGGRDLVSFGSKPLIFGTKQKVVRAYQEAIATRRRALLVADGVEKIDAV
jgi:hypothetical protein